jgi:hypothetical protein
VGLEEHRKNGRLMISTRGLLLLASVALFARGACGKIVTFSVSGMLTDGAALSGTITVDNVAGLVTAANLTFGAPVSKTFSVIAFNGLNGLSDWAVQIDPTGTTTPGIPPDFIITFPTSTLVGYQGGSFCSVSAPCNGGGVASSLQPGGAAVNINLQGGSASNGAVLFSDLGPGGIYGNSFYPVYGSTATINPTSQTSASLFTVAGSGSMAVTQIDLGVAIAGSNTSVSQPFAVSIWTDNSGLPGARLANAYWSLSTGSPCNAGTQSCPLVSITGISGVTLTGGAQYFMVVEPVSVTDNNFVGWYLNNQGVLGDLAGSGNGGGTWSGPFAGASLGAFDVLGMPQGNSTYYVNLTVGSGSVIGDIVTDGTTGVLAQANIIGYDLQLSEDTRTFHLSCCNFFPFTGSDLSATATQLLFNFSGMDNGAVVFADPSLDFDVCFSTFAFGPGNSLCEGAGKTLTFATIACCGLQFMFTGQSGTQVIASTNPVDIALRADFNGDGTDDVIWQDPVTGLAQVWFLGGAQGTNIIGAANLTASNSWRIVGVGDFNRDGHPDVVWQDPVSGAAQVWFLGGAQGNAVTGAATLSNSNSWRIMSVADFNGDGQPDVIWQDPVSGLAQIWLMGGAQGTTVTAAVNLTASNTWRIVGTGDFNQDGHPDVLWQDPVSGTTQIWYLGGAQGNVVTNAVNLTGGNTWRIAAVADFNLDGHPDVVFQDPVSGASQVWFLGGTLGTTITGTAPLSGSNLWRIAGPR